MSSLRGAAGPTGPPASARSHLVEAVARALDEPFEAALALQAAVDASSWDEVERRVTVAERALRADAELEPWRGPVEEPPASPRDERWAVLWRDVSAVARLARRAGYPPEVLA